LQPFIGLYPTRTGFFSILGTGFYTLFYFEMAAKQSRYTSLEDDIEDIDLENDSDTTLASDGFLSKNNTRRISKPTKNSRLENILTWSRWSIIVLLQGLIIVLLLPTSGVLSDGWSMGGSGWSHSKTETGGDINGLYIPSE
jgi:hypothetical protein